MRNFEERKAEIFRRSEDRINKRRRTRKHILTIVPLCLLLVVCAVTVMPEMRSKALNNITGEIAPMPEIWAEQAILSAEIEKIPTAAPPQYYGKQQYLLTEGAEGIAQFYDSIESAFVSGEALKPTQDNENMNDGDTVLSGNGEHLTIYRITFTTAEGEKVVYTLNGYVLAKEGSDDCVVLTEYQRKSLLETLEDFEEEAE